MTIEADLNLMKLDSDILLGLQSYVELLQTYISQYPFLNINSANQNEVDKFYKGLYSLSLGYSALVEAFKEMCYAKNIVVKS